jgi:hypothetical protein
VDHKVTQTQNRILINLREGGENFLFQAKIYLKMLCIVEIIYKKACGLGTLMNFVRCVKEGSF